MPRYNRQQDFESGLSQLAGFFASQGFVLIPGQPDVDKEGTSYSARFIRDPRSVEINHLYSLGPVIYSIQDWSLEHRAYFRALGLSEVAQFPAYVDDSVSGYPALLHDLKLLLPNFFMGAEAEFIAIARRYRQEERQHQEREAINLAYRCSEDSLLKHRAREMFRAGRFDEVVQIESQIRFPERLTASERQIFSVARRRVTS